MRFFKPEEFREWFPYMCPVLLETLDDFRRLWGKPITISPHADALGRKLPITEKTMHNINLWGDVKAVDFFPKGMETKEDMQRAFGIAKKVGFTGIGLYTDTKPSNMMHCDVRPDRTPANPATWARVNGIYVGIDEVLK